MPKVIINNESLDSFHSSTVFTYFLKKTVAPNKAKGFTL